MFLPKIECCNLYNTVSHKNFLSHILGASQKEVWDKNSILNFMVNDFRACTQNRLLIKQRHRLKS